MDELWSLAILSSSDITMNKNDRLQALLVLKKILDNKMQLSQAIQETISPLCKAICFGVCRQYFRLEKIAYQLLKKRPPETEVWLAILMGLYQLQFMNKPEYATVKETVGLLDILKKTWAKGFVNAILRRYGREKDIILNKIKQDPQFLYGHPTWFIQRVQSDWPQEWESILTANDTHPPFILRVNSQKISVEEYQSLLCSDPLDPADKQRNVGLEKHLSDSKPALIEKVRLLPYSAVGLELSPPCEVSELPGFQQGLVSVQDQAAQLAPGLLDIKPGLTLLDACCAPGGKTCHILETEPKLAECIALDIDINRLKRVRENLKRLELHAKIVQGDALNPTNWWNGHTFDRILLDAPCSATGVIRRHPDIKLLRSEEDINSVLNIQASLLHNLWPLLKPGGLMLYATCSIMKAENEEQIANFLSKEKNAEVATESKDWGKNTGFGWQILPGECDGFFYSLLRKRQ
jgi:16S rRNA (cytosine967-C5)-methyltransferase